MNSSSEEVGSQFKLVGHRVKHLRVSEHAVLGLDGQLKLRFESSTPEPRLAAGAFDGRDVIEVSISLGIHSPIDKGEYQELVSGELAGGFVGVEPICDADFEKFKLEVGFYRRALFWLLRDRVGAVLRASKLAPLQLPWDLAGMESHVVPSTRVPVKKLAGPKGRVKVSQKKK